MSLENWRLLSYYTLGLLPSLFFSLRFLIQWISSERKKKSHVPKIFWHLSLIGNVLLALHFFIQVQYLLMMIQVVSGFIAWRNLDLQGGKKSLTAALAILAASAVGASALFFAQLHWIKAPLNLFEIPFSLKRGDVSLPLEWHLIGSFGCLLFASRFWVQWIEAERREKSQIGNTFWLLSIGGSAIALLYFTRAHDWVSILNYSFGLVPYVRNLILSMKKARESSLARHTLSDK